MNDTVMLLDSETIGRGDDELGKILMRNFLHVLAEARPGPRQVILVNSGVKLAAEGSEVLEDLRSLLRQGVEVLSCGTCVQFFDLKDRLAVGQVTNMHAIVQALLSGREVVTV